MSSLSLHRSDLAANAQTRLKPAQHSYPRHRSDSLLTKAVPLKDQDSGELQPLEATKGIETTSTW